MTKSPFRYPGGKSRLVPYLLPHIEYLLKGEFHDVFVGGGSILLAVASCYPKVKLYANDLSPHMYAFWKAMTSDNLCRKLIALLYTQPTVKLFRELKDNTDNDIVSMAYKAIFFNRTSFSGIIGSGPIGGYDQKSKWAINCRWNSGLLIAQISGIRSLVRGRLEVSNLDFAGYLMEHKDVCSYLDPPYYEKGKDLYDVSMSDAQHKTLAQMLKLRKSWVLSYDYNETILQLYKWSAMVDINARYSISGENRKSWSNKKEIIILGSPKSAELSVETGSIFDFA